MYLFICLDERKAMVRLHTIFIILTLFIVGISGCARRVPTSIPENTSNKPPATKVDALFIAYDYGESLAFKSVIPYLKSSGISIRLLTFGAADKALSDMPETVQLTSLLTTQQKAEYANLINGWQTQRTETLPANVLDDIVSMWQPTVVVTGMAATMQAQLTNHFALKDAYTVAFYDNFDNPKTQSFVHPWLAATKGVNEIFVPGDYLIDDFLKIQPLSSSEITVTGQPALDQWSQFAKNINKESVFEKLGVEKNSRIVTFAAGYDQSSLKWADKFIDAATERPDILFFIALHPKMQNTEKLSLVKKVAGLKNVKIAPSTVNTEELVSISRLLATHKSTVGMKAAYIGVPVLYVAENSYNNILISSNLAARADTWSEIINAIHRLLDHPVKQTNTFKELGIPSQAIFHFYARLLKIIDNTKKKVGPPILESIHVDK